MLVDRRFDRARYEGLRKVERFLADLRAGRAAPGGDGRRARRGARRPEPRALLLAARPRSSTSTRRGARARSARPRARARTPVRRGALLLGDGRARRGARRAPRPARQRDRRRRAGDRDRPPAGRGAPPARRGRGVARADRHRRLRGAPPAGARPARRRPAAAGLDRPRAPPRPEPAARRRAAKRTSSTPTVAELADAIEELRELARGVRPAGLDDGPRAGPARARVALAAARPGRGHATSASRTGSRPRPTSSPARR